MADSASRRGESESRRTRVGANTDVVFSGTLLIWLDQSRGDRLFFISSSLARDPQLVSVNRRSDHTDIRGLITAFHLFVWGYLTLVPCVQIFLRTKERRGFPVPDDNTNY